MNWIERIKFRIWQHRKNEREWKEYVKQNENWRKNRQEQWDKEDLEQYLKEKK